MKLWGVGLLAMGWAASHGDVLAQPTDTVAPPPVRPPVAAPVRPPAVMNRPPSSPPSDRPKFATLEEEVAQWGAAPAAGSDTTALPAEKKAARAVHVKRGQDRQTCTNAGPMKDWMAAPKLAACDRQLALAPATEDDAWDMRARLLQQRAVALLALGGDRLALAALDEADAVGAAPVNDGLFEVGTGMGNELLRAYIEGRLGDRPGALARLDRIRAARPFAASLIAAADSIQIAMGGDLATLRTRLDASAALDPEAQRTLFILNLLEGRLADAATVGDQISLREPKMRGNWTVIGGPDEAERVEQRTAVLALRAYVAGAQGNSARAAALFGEARTDVAAYIGEDPRTKERFSQASVNQYLDRAAKGRTMQTMLADCEALIAVRKDAATLTLDTLTDRMQALGGPGPHKLILGVEIMRNISGDDATRAAIGDRATRSILQSALTLAPADIGSLLPTPEYLPHVPKFKPSPSLFMWGGGAGWSVAREGETGIRTVRYENWAGGRAMMEEMLLLATAQMARAEGYDGFVILSNRSFSRQTTTTGMWGSSTYDSGFEAQARIQLVSGASLPSELAGAPDRVITVARIERELWPRYQSYFERQAAIKEARKEARRSKS